jgi:hypothetical protein
MSETSLVQRVDAIPGRLSIHVHAHEVPSRDGLTPCWSFVTAGFADEGHPELLFSVRRGLTDAREEPPRGALELFRAVWHRLHAVEGALLQSGDVLALEPGTFLGRDDVRGVGVLQEIPMPGVPAAKRPRLMLMGLVGEEHAVARDYGLARVAARLGQEEGMFPTAPWFDRKRIDLARNDRAERTVLGRCLRVTCRAGSAVVERDTIVLELPSSAAEALRAPLGDLPADTGLVLLLPIDPRADGLLVWEPGARELTAIGSADAQGARVSGNFLALVPGQPADGSNPLEDGFAVRVTDLSWTALRRALAAGEPFELPAQDDSLPFALRWT